MSIESEDTSGPIQRLVLILVLLVVGLFVFRLAVPTEYAYAIEANSQQLALNINPSVSGSVKWRTQGVVFCSRHDLSLPEFPQAQSLCGSSRLKPYHSGDAEQVLEVLSAATVQLSSRVGGGLQMSLKSVDSSQPVARISLSDGAEAVTSTSNLILLWPRTGSSVTVPRSHGVYPFTGKLVLGRDVGWTRNRLLLSGKVTSFTNDDSAAIGRREVSSNELILGDQLTLEAVTNTGGGWYKRLLLTWRRITGSEKITADNAQFPNGFIYYQDGEESFEVRVFGYSNGLKLTRYGGQGFDLQPGFLARLSNDPLLAWAVPFLLLLINLVNNLKGLGHIKYRFIRAIEKLLFWKGS